MRELSRDIYKDRKKVREREREEREWEVKKERKWIKKIVVIVNYCTQNIF